MGDMIQEQNWTKVFVPSVVLYVGVFVSVGVLSIINTVSPSGRCVFML